MLFLTYLIMAFLSALDLSVLIGNESNKVFLVVIFGLLLFSTAGLLTTVVALPWTISLVVQVLFVYLGFETVRFALRS